MVIVAGSGGWATPSVTIGTPGIPSFQARRIDEYAMKDKNISELITATQEAITQEKKTTPRTYQFSNEKTASELYLDNLRYIQANPPKKSGSVENNDGIGMDDILDAIFYASAIASIIPYPPVSIGGRIGLLASGAGRSIYNGNTRGGTQQLLRLFREVDRGTRQYRAYSKVRDAKARPTNMKGRK